MRDLLESDAPYAAEAVELFVYHIGKHLSALAGVLEGLDALVFTAGIGENAAVVRERVCRRAEWLGVRLDEEANCRGGPRISTADSSVSVWVIPTNEELMIARHTDACLKRPQEKENENRRSTTGSRKQKSTGGRDCQRALHSLRLRQGLP
jgi:acetate kinase